MCIKLIHIYKWSYSSLEASRLRYPCESNDEKIRLKSRVNSGKARTDHVNSAEFASNEARLPKKV